MASSVGYAFCYRMLRKSVIRYGAYCQTSLKTMVRRLAKGPYASGFKATASRVLSCHLGILQFSIERLQRTTPWVTSTVS